MIVSVKGYLTLKELVGERAVDLPDSDLTVRRLLSVLSEEIGDDFASQLRYDTSGQLEGNLVVLVNGRHCSHLPDGIDTQLNDGDEVAIFPPIAGG
jgi:molybdopterin synthase sulfur carrier subunit